MKKRTKSTTIGKKRGRSRPPRQNSETGLVQDICCQLHEAFSAAWSEEARDVLDVLVFDPRIPTALDTTVCWNAVVWAGLVSSTWRRAWPHPSSVGKVIYELVRARETTARSRTRRGSTRTSISMALIMRQSTAALEVVRSPSFAEPIQVAVRRDPHRHGHELYLAVTSLLLAIETSAANLETRSKWSDAFNWKSLLVERLWAVTGMISAYRTAVNSGPHPDEPGVPADQRWPIRMLTTLSDLGNWSSAFINGHRARPGQRFVRPQGAYAEFAERLEKLRERLAQLLAARKLLQQEQQRSGALDEAFPIRWYTKAVREGSDGKLKFDPRKAHRYASALGESFVQNGKHAHYSFQRMITFESFGQYRPHWEAAHARMTGKKSMNERA